MIQAQAYQQGTSQHDVQAFFKPASWSLKFDFINQLVFNNNVMMALIAETGGGKTTFCKLLPANLSDNITVVALQDLKTTHPVADLVARATMQMEQPFNTLDEVLDFVTQAAQHYLFVIDDAERYDQSFFITLLQLLQRQAEKGYLHILLAGNADLSRKLQDLERNSDYQNYIHAFEPGALKKSEMKTYVQHKIAMQQDGILRKIKDESQWDAFYELTSGSLARIHDHLDFFTIKKGSPMKFVTAASIAVLSFSAAYFVFHQDKINETMTVTQPVALASQPTAPSDKPATHQFPGSFKSDNTIVLREGNPPGNNDTLVQVVAVTKGRAIMAASEMQHDTVFALASADAHTILSEKMSHNPEQEHYHARSAQIPEHNNMIQQAVASGRVMHQAPRIAAHKAQKGYTIQLVASRKREDIENFMMQHHLENEAAMKTSLRDGLVWYVLTYGRYQNRKQATLALRDLPGSARQQSPWIRKERELATIG